VPVTISINTADLTGLGVLSADTTFSYDPAVLSPAAADISVTAGSVAQDAEVNYNASTAGTIVISVFSSTAFAGGGTVADLHMKVKGAVGSVSPLTLTNFRYNGGLVCSNGTSGTLTVVSGTITGRVSLENQPYPFATVSPTPTPLPLAGTTITASGVPSFAVNADTGGNYSLSGFGPGMYTVTPSRPNESFMAPNGIFSNDAALVAQHVVNLITLNSVQQRAADVSGLHSLSSFDAALIAQWVVGIPNMINQTGHWKFTPPSTSPDVVNDSTQDYAGLLLGDVDGNWSVMPTGPLSSIYPDSGKAVKASVPNIKAPAGSSVVVPLSLTDLRGREVSSFQFDIVYDPAVIRPANIAADLNGTVGQGLSIVSNSPAPGLLKVAVYGTEPVAGDGLYANLHFVTVGKIGAETALTINAFRLNDGTDRVIGSAGVLQVTPWVIAFSDSNFGSVFNITGDPPPPGPLDR
jgi:hypothetical protein